MKKQATAKKIKEMKGKKYKIGKEEKEIRK
jgi:hypothetical protein